MNGLLRGLNGPRGMVAASRQSTPDQQKEAPRYSPASIVLVLQSRFLTLGFVGGVAELANAETWNQNHPRRAEVNARLANQNHRVNDELREGEMTRGQARTLHAQDRFIRREERFMARQNRGHITRAEQRSLNQQENAVSRKIGR